MAGINANVSLTLEELDGLRREISDGNKRIHEQALEIAKIQSEKMQVKVTMKQLYSYPTVEAREVLKTIKRSEYGISTEMASTWNSNFNRYGGYGVPDYIQAKVLVYDEVMKSGEIESIEYLNLEAIQNQLAMKAEEKVADKLTILSNKVTSLLNEKSHIETEFYSKNAEREIQNTKEINKLRSDYEQKIDEINDSNEKDVKRLKDEIKSLKDEEVEKTKDKVIEDLKKEIAELKKKPKSFFNKVFSMDN